MLSLLPWVKEGCMISSIALDVVYGLIVTIILAFIVWLTRQPIKKFIFILFGHISGEGLIFTYKNREESKRIITKSLENASFVYIMTGRGIDFQKEPFSVLLSEKRLGRKNNVHILLPTSWHIRSETDWTAINEKELSRLDPAYGEDLLYEQIKTTTKVLKPYHDDSIVRVRQKNFPHIGQIIITDRNCFVNFYNDRTHSRFRPVFQYRRDGSIYDYFLRLFILLWDEANEI